jgi:hypothetical protein
MKYRIEKMNTQLSFVEDKKLLKLTGYAFIDEMNKCFFIIYGENKRDMLIKHL